MKFSADLFTFTTETLNRKCNFLYSESLLITLHKGNKISQFSKHELLLKTLNVLWGNNR